MSKDVSEAEDRALTSDTSLLMRMSDVLEDHLIIEDD